MSWFCLNEGKPGIFLFNASKQCLHACTTATTPPCSSASRLSPPNVLDSTERCDPPRHRKKSLVSTESKQSSFGRKTWRGGNKGSRAVHRCCPLWDELLQTVISKFQKKSFCYKATPLAPTSRDQVFKFWLEITCAYQAGHTREGDTSVWPLPILGCPATFSSPH